MTKANQLKYRIGAVAIVATALIVQFALVIRSPPIDEISTAPITRRSPPFSALRLEDPNAAITDADLASGQTVVLNFFASWCGPCAIEHPLLMKLAETAPIIGIDHMDRSADAARYLARLGNPYRAVGVDADGKILAAFGFDSIPTTVVLNGSGDVIYVHRGRLKDADIDKIVRPLLSKVAP